MEQAFKETRYWRIPVPPAPIFATLIDGLRYDSSGCQDIRLAKIIHHILGLESPDEYSRDENDGDGGPGGGSGLNDDNEGGGGPSGGGRASSKRKEAGGKSDAPLQRAQRGFDNRQAAVELGLVMNRVVSLLVRSGLPLIKPFAQLRISSPCSVLKPTT